MLKFVQFFFIPLLLSVPVLPKPIQAANPAANTNDYDYIVVGSGPGGGPLASNLARAGYSVLLLEAGDQSVVTGSDPYPPQVTWDFFVKHYEDLERQMKFSHLTWRRADGSYWVGRDNPPADAKLLGVYYPRGSSVGGSSMINAMMTWLPTANDWNHISNLTGDSSWGASNMRKIFERLEHNNYLANGTAGHGFDGYLQTSMNKATSLRDPVLSIMQSTAKAVGKDPNDVVQLVNGDPNFLDPKRDQTEGIWGSVAHAYPDGTRYSSRDRILETISANFSLTLQQNSLVTKVLFDKGTARNSRPRATGVEYLHGASLYRADARYNPNNKGMAMQAFAKKEVILSGGTYNSPQLLMLSGIGSSEQLKQFNISVLVDSPGVGRNLQVNPEMSVVAHYQGNVTTDRGGNAMLKTPYAVWDERDMFVMQGTSAFRGYWPANQTNTALPVDPPGTYGLGLYKQHPQSRAGYVKLRSADPQDTPEINYNLYMQGNETDLGAMKYAVAWARKVYAGTAAPVGPINVVEPPPCSSDDCSQADEDWITASTFGNHPIGTCAIGAHDDKNAVVDSKFRVRGVDGLRVIDASVFPRSPGVFPVVATFMVSEKGSDVVLEDAEKDVR